MHVRTLLRQVSPSLLIVGAALVACSGAGSGTSEATNSSSLTSGAGEGALAADGGVGPFHWRTIGPGTNGGMRGVTLSYTHPLSMIAGLDEGSAYMSHDDGASWKAVGQMGQTPAAQPGGHYFMSGAFDPSDAKRVYSTTAEGVFGSSDGGVHWTQLWQPASNHWISAITVDPTDGAILYITDGDSTVWSYSGHPDGNVWRSADHGATWTLLPRPGGKETGANAGRSYSRILVDPKNHEHVYVGGNGGVFASSDSGQHWTDLAATLPLPAVNLSGSDGIVVTPVSDIGLTTGSANESGLLVATRFFQNPATKTRDILGGIYATTSGGKTWTALTTEGLDAPEKKSPDTYLYLRSSPSKPDTVYVASVDQVYSSTNGAAWKPLTRSDCGQPSPEPAEYPATGEEKSAKGQYYLCSATGTNFANTTFGNPGGIDALDVSFDPSGDDTIAFTFIGGVAVSTNSGGNWSEPIFKYGAAFGDPSDIPEELKGFAPSDATHLQISTGAQLVVPRGLAVDPFNAANIAVGYDDVGLRISRDSGYSWEWAYKGIPFLDQHNIEGVAYDPKVKDQMFAGGGGKWGAGYLHVYQSTNGGATFTNIGLPLTIAQKQDGVVGSRTTANLQTVDSHYTGVHDIAVAPSSTATSARIYVATSIGVFEGLGTKSSSGAAMQWQWYDISGPIAGQWVQSVRIDPFDSETVLASVGGNPSGAPGGLYISTTAGQSWTQMGKGQFADVLTLSLSRSQRGHYLANAAPVGSGERHVYLYKNTGITSQWTQLAPPAGLHSALISFADFSPADASTIYIGTDAQNLETDPMGLFLSRDQGATWEAFGAGDNGIPFSLFSNPFYPGSANAQIVFDPSNARHLFLLHNFGVNEAWDPGPGGGL